jgi:hypothetical protein
MMPPMSSKIASAVRNTTSACEIRARTSVRHPMEKAMSVAIGMAQPPAAGVPALKSR